MKKIILSAQLILKWTLDLKEFSAKNINEITDYNNNKIVENISCKYLKDNIKYEDIIYIILTNNMKKNLSNNNIEII